MPREVTQRPRGQTRLERADRALLVDGLLDESRERYLAAHASAHARGDAESTARAALGLGGLWVHEQRGAVDALAAESRQRLALAGLPSRSPLALRLRTRLAAEADYRDGTATRVTAALRDARGHGDPVALAEALTLTHHCLLGPGRERSRLLLAEALLRTAADTGRRVDLLTGLLWRAVDLLLAGHWYADRAVAEVRAALEETPHAAYAFVLQATDVMRATRAGRFAEAHRLAADCAAAGERAGDADALGWLGAQTIALAWFEGRLDALRPELEELVTSPQLGAVSAGHTSALAVACAQDGDRLRAESLVARLREELGRSSRSSGWLATAYGTVEAAHVLGDADTAAHVARLLRPYAALPVTPSLAVTCFGPVHQALGVAALTTGDLDVAVAELSAAVRRSLTLGHLPAAALAGHRLSQALGLRGAGGDDAMAARFAAEARTRAEGIGMPLPPVPEAGHRHTGRVAFVRSPGPTVGAPEPAPRSTWLERRGRRWSVRTPAAAAEVEDCVGLHHLAHLVARAGTDVSALDLASAVPADRSGAVRRTGAIVRLPAGQELVDRRALADYRRHLVALDGRIAELEADGDLARADQARAERDWVAAELRRVVGVGGRPRSFADDAERARVAVTKAIGRALDRTARVDQDVADYLRARVRTGLVCVYDPGMTAVSASPPAPRAG